MTDNNTNNEMIPEQKEVIAFFVPALVAAYVTEILELALRHLNVVVCAGTLGEVPKGVGVPISALRPDIAVLPDVAKPEPVLKMKEKKPVVERKQKKYRTITTYATRSKHFKLRKIPAKLIRKKKTVKPEDQWHCCVNRMAQRLEEHYGKAIPSKDGHASAPRLMMQYPGLPFFVPVNQEFTQTGVPRHSVDFRYDAIFTVDPKVQMPAIPPLNEITKEPTRNETS